VTRYVVIRNSAQEELVVGETPLPSEADLHDVLTSHPELLPAEDIGMGRVVVVGQESGLASGYADLVYVDHNGQICLVEVKKEGNPDTRRVVAQLLDYAAALWGKSLEEFEDDVVRPYFVRLGKPASTLREFLSQEFAVASADEAADELDMSKAAEIESALTEVLTSGEFRLVVAAPSIPEGVQRVLRYLNSQGLRLYGLEVSYFKGPVECFVPRLVVEPPQPGDGDGGPATKRKKWNEDMIVAALEKNHGEVEADIARSIFRWAKERHLIPNFGKGATNGWYWPGLDDEVGQMFPFTLSTYGTILINFGDMVTAPYRPFDEESKRRDLQRRLSGINGVQIPDAKLDRWPKFKVSVLAEREALSEFIRIMDWAFDEAEEVRRGFGPSAE
jgi:hypothetical protein